MDSTFQAKKEGCVLRSTNQVGAVYRLKMRKCLTYKNNINELYQELSWTKMAKVYSSLLFNIIAVRFSFIIISKKTNIEINSLKKK